MHEYPTFYTLEFSLLFSYCYSHYPPYELHM